ncbi:MAG: hypothetical protein NDF54_05925, partial [archaeon GB-1867-035]|nr:hypothetical protein [Candidatus Culexmicrobium profundum]
FYFSKIFPKYFKYKYGESYILDVSSLFNYSEPIVTFSKSISTCIEIKLDIPSFASFEILEINPKKLNVYRERKEGMITGYWITNLPPGKPFIGGEVLDRIYVKFKVIQAGTTIPFGGIKLIGGIMVSLVFLIASIFVYFMYRKMIVKT